MMLISMANQRSPMKIRTSVLVLGLDNDDDNDDDDDDREEPDDKALALWRGSSTVLNPSDARCRSSACLTAS